MKRPGLILYGATAYILFNAAFLYMIGFLLELPVPKAINSRPYGGRPRCMYGGACRSYGCPIHAKATTLSVSLPRAERTKKLDLRIEAMVYELPVDDHGRVQLRAVLD